MSKLRVRLSRLPLRGRLVAGFSVASLIVLFAAGISVYWRVDYALDRGIDTELTQARHALEPLVGPDGRVRSRSTADATGVPWQVLAKDGTVIDRGGAAGDDPLVSPGQLERVGASPRTLNVGGFLHSATKPYRVQMVPLSASPRRYLLIGVRRDQRDEALQELFVQLVLTGLGALLVTALVGDRLAHAALRPVERYRRQAAAITAGNTGLRLDVPPQRDDEITRLGDTFNDMLTSLEAALDRERQFVTEASHELRTPITLLTSRIQLARRRPRSPAEHERILTELTVDLDRLAALSEQLLQLGRAQGGHPAGHSDLVTVTARTVNQRRLAEPDNAGSLTVTLPEDPVLVPMADFELERVVTNLLDNAAVHGAPPVQVSLDEPATGWARLMVVDAGPGMPAGLLTTATQRFTRAEEARSRPGSGLGLSLVGTLVSRADGELRLCHDGGHATYGSPAPVACAHGPEMTVTVLLPTTPAGTDQAD